MQFNITFKTIFEYVLKKLVLCIQIRFVSTEKTTRIASRASCLCGNAVPMRSRPTTPLLKTHEIAPFLKIFLGGHAPKPP